MNVATGSRPWSIKAFVVIVAVLALAELTNRLINPEYMLGELDLYFSTAEWTPDMAVIAAFSLFSMALIPILWIYVFAAPLARWMVTFFLSVKFLHSLALLLAALWFADGTLLALMRPLLIGFALGILFSANAEGWFAGRARVQ